MRTRQGAGMVAALSMVLIEAACGSRPTQYYQLSASPPSTAPQAGSSCLRAPLSVQRVSLPETLDRLSIVRAKGPHELAIAGEQRWAAPLDGMVQQVLAQDLQTRLPAGAVLLPGEPAPPSGATALSVSIERFLPDAAGQVELRADWTLTSPGGAVSGARPQSLSTTAGTTTEDAVAGMSQALGQLAGRIAASLNACS